MKFLFWSLSYIVVFSAAAMSQTTAEKNPHTRTVEEGPRQFDFWVGEWDVNLRVNNKGQWVDRTKARCTVYEILDGKAIMELWNAPQIKGFSIRYYNPGTRNWSLWLNWPGNNSSRWFNLSGSFRHGRGEFYTSFVNNGDSILSRYTFSDITPNSLRWDDGFSKDKGLTWSSNWIMEFSRTAAEAPWAAPGKPLNTYSDHSRCSSPEFNYFDAILPIQKGTCNKNGREEPVSFEAHPALDGCAIIYFITIGDGKEGRKYFTMATFNRDWGKTALYVLDNKTGNPMRNYYWDEDEEAFVSTNKASKIKWNFSGKSYSLFNKSPGGEWVPEYRIRFD